MCRDDHSRTGKRPFHIYRHFSWVQQSHVLLKQLEELEETDQLQKEILLPWKLEYSVLESFDWIFSSFISKHGYRTWDMSEIRHQAPYFQDLLSFFQVTLPPPNEPQSLREISILKIRSIVPKANIQEINLPTSLEIDLKKQVIFPN